MITKYVRVRLRAGTTRAECYFRPDQIAHMHKLPATAIATQEAQTGTSNPATSTGHSFKARTAWNTAMTPKRTPETTTYLLGMVPSYSVSDAQREVEVLKGLFNPALPSQQL
jgi:hypothetical protein